MRSMSSAATIRRGRWLAPTLRGYRREWLLPDLLAGVAAGAVVIPQAMADATIANLPVQVGIYTCILPMLVYAIGNCAAAAAPWRSPGSRMPPSRSHAAPPGIAALGHPVSPAAT